MPTNPNPVPARTARSSATIRIKLIEGALVAGFAMGARAAYIYIRGEFIREPRCSRRRSRKPMRRV
jgi:hypothetical protein